VAQIAGVLPDKPQQPRFVSVDWVLGFYLKTLPENALGYERQAYGVLNLMNYWTDKHCGDITEDTCKEFTATCKTSSTARRDLGVLRAALNVGKRRGLLEHAPVVWLPKEKQARPFALTRDQVAMLIWDLRKRAKSKHTARFLLCMYYTGSRPGTIARTTWSARSDGPYVDLEEEIWYRIGEDEQRSNKQREPHAIPPNLLAHLRRWHAAMLRERQNDPSVGRRYVIEYQTRPGRPVLDVGGSLERACERLKLPRITPHQMKHTAITNGVRSGVTLEEAEEYFSTSAATIKKNYWHRSPHFQARARKIMNAPGKVQQNPQQKPPNDQRN
jgi:integrase